MSDQSDEFDELKQDCLEVFEEDVNQTLEYHEVIQAGQPGASPIDADFGFVATASGAPNTVKTDLLYSHVYVSGARGRLKKLHLAQDEFTGDYDAKIYIPTADLERRSVVLKRDNAYLRLPDGEQYRIEAIQPIPRMYGTSVVHRVYVTRRKPIEDRGGAN